MSEILIFGTGEYGRAVRHYFDNDSDHTVVGFATDDEYLNELEIDGLPVIGWSAIQVEYPPHAYGMHVALSYSKCNLTRAAKYAQVKGAGYTLPSYISSKAVIGRNVQIGENCCILELNNLQFDVIIGNNVMLWAGNHIGHGTRVGDHTYLASHICISGHCVIGERCFFGVNAATRDFCTIGDDTAIFMGVNVTTKNVAPGSILTIGKESTLSYAADDRIGARIRKSYFG